MVIDFFVVTHTYWIAPVLLGNYHYWQLSFVPHTGKVNWVNPKCTWLQLMKNICIKYLYFTYSLMFMGSRLIEFRFNCLLTELFWRNINMAMLLVQNPYALKWEVSSHPLFMEDSCQPILLIPCKSCSCVLQIIAMSEDAEREQNMDVWCAC